jgi:hypothetical protein
MWPNVLGALFAFAALFSDLLRLSRQVTQLLALGAVGIFGVSGVEILRPNLDGQGRLHVGRTAMHFIGLETPPFYRFQDSRGQHTWPADWT